MIRKCRDTVENKNIGLEVWIMNMKHGLTCLVWHRTWQLLPINNADMTDVSPIEHQNEHIDRGGGPTDP